MKVANDDSFEYYSVFYSADIYPITAPSWTVELIEYYKEDKTTLNSSSGGTSSQYGFSDAILANALTGAVDLSVYRSFYVSDGGIETNIPIFESVEDAIKYIQTGVDPNFDNSSLYLTGFSIDDSINATWEDVIVPDGFNKEDVVVEVSCNYFIMLEKGEEYIEFDSPSSVFVSYPNKSFSRPLSDYFDSNPYDGRCMLFLYFTPYIGGNAGVPICVTFDENRQLTEVTLPDGALETIMSSDCYFLNPMATSEFHNWGDSYIFFRWTGVSVQGNTNYISSDVVVELYCHDGLGNWAWVPYEAETYNFNTKKIDFNLTELQSYAADAGFYFGKIGSQGNYDGEKIRIIPTYRTGSQYVKGEPIEITLGLLGGVDKIEQIEGDGSITDLDPVYDPIDGIIDEVTNSGGTVNPDGSVNISDLSSLTINFFDMLKTLIQACGQFPALVANVFAFLPSYFDYMIIVGLGMIILLRLLGR